METRYKHIILNGDYDHAMRVIGNKGIEITQRAEGKFSGTMHSKPPADFFSFQVSFDKFSTDQNSRDTVREHIVAPIIEYLEHDELIDQEA